MKSFIAPFTAACAYMPLARVRNISKRRYADNVIARKS